LFFKLVAAAADSVRSASGAWRDRRFAVQLTQLKVYPRVSS
jgi:hypothetical protein